jgi:hypothetical protein
MRPVSSPSIGSLASEDAAIAVLTSRCLQVIVVTGTYGSKNQRQGVRYMTNGLKVYYCPQMSIHDQASLPTLYGFFPLFRQVCAPIFLAPLNQPPHHLGVMCADSAARAHPGRARAPGKLS